MSESGSRSAETRYVPGPHTGSASGREKDRPNHGDAPRSRLDAASAAVPPAVLSMKGCRRKPVTLWLGVWVPVWLRVDVNEGVELALGLCVGEGVCVCDGEGLGERVPLDDRVSDCVSDGVCDCEGVCVDDAVSVCEGVCVSEGVAVGLAVCVCVALPVLLGVCV